MKGFAFFVELDFENIPSFCTHCKKIGPYIDIYKNVNKVEANEEI